MDLDAVFDILRNEGRMRGRYFVRRPVSSSVSYEEDYWGEVVDPDGKRRNLVEEKDKKIEDCREEIEFINSLSPGRILDVGCGFGYLLSAISDAWEKYGIEISKYACEIAAEYGTIANCTLEQAGYPDEFFDAAVMYHVIEHVEEPESLIREVCRVLKKGGAFVIGTPNFDSGCARRFRKNYRLLYPGESHISLFTTHSLRRLLEDSGFEVDRIEYPFFGTRHFTDDSLRRLADVSTTSPPFYGNIMTFYCRKRDVGLTCRLLGRSAKVIMDLAACQEDQIEAAIGLVSEALNEGRQVLICGNGGSAAQAQHLAGELVGRFRRERRGLPAIALSIDSTILTAIGNDYGFENVFSRQVAAYGREGDVLVAFSTSGKSPNVISALEQARKHRMRSVAIVGATTDAVQSLADVVVSVPCQDTPLIQDAHSALCHAMCECLEQRVSEEPSK